MKNILIIPTYNERSNVAIIVPKIFSILPDIEVVIVDDNSPDGTADEVRQLSLKYKNLKLISRPQKLGLGAAYKETISQIIKDPDIFSVTTMDADGSHDPAYLPTMLGKLNSADIVIGSRYVNGGGVEGWETWRRLLSYFGNAYARTVTGLPITDCTAGFISAKKSLLEKIDFENLGASGYAFLIELKFNCIYFNKAAWAEIPIVFKNRLEGESKISSHIIREGIVTPLRLFCAKWFFYE